MVRAVQGARVRPRAEQRRRQPPSDQRALVVALVSQHACSVDAPHGRCHVAIQLLLLPALPRNG